MLRYINEAKNNHRTIRLKNLVISNWPFSLLFDDDTEEDLHTTDPPPPPPPLTAPPEALLFGVPAAEASLSRETLIAVANLSSSSSLLSSMISSSGMV